ncbi:MAG: polysaccharide deacetylase family protein [Gammaproteobacteria bacterium]|nr:polysaccharide deacetylase family protein [Gammaproteobacteria bacterium]
MNWFYLLLALAAGLAVSYQFAWWRPTVSYAAPRILMYHMISRQKPKARFNKLRVDPAEFERQIRWLRDDGWKFLLMSEIESSNRRKCVAITFDDGYRDNLLIADPILEKYDAKATLYLVVDRHDRDWSKSKKLHHADGELMNEPKLLDADVHQMLNSGRWELGAHTQTHANLESVSSNQRKEEIQSSRAELQDLFHTEVSSFAYPFGIFGRKDVAAVAAAGYRTAVTTEQGISGNVASERLELRRVKVGGHDGLLSFRLRMRTGKCRWRD